MWGVDRSSLPECPRASITRLLDAQPPAQQIGRKAPEISTRDGSLLTFDRDKSRLIHVSIEEIVMGCGDQRLCTYGATSIGAAKS